MEERKEQTKKAGSRLTRAVSLAVGSAIAFSTLWSVLGASFAHAQGATLYLSPSSGTYTVGQTFSVGVYVSSKDEAMNAVSGTVTFPSANLAVTGISKTGSIVSLWTQDPSFSNTAGTINFEGIVLNPGYTGGNGLVVSITFKAVSAGTPRVPISAGAILANDGLGTNIMAGLGAAQFSIVQTVQPEQPTPSQQVPPELLPGAPEITSNTHPDQQAWSTQRDATFAWDLPKGIQGVSVSLDHVPNGDPGTESDGDFATKSYSGIADGLWYFHARLLNGSGWGPVATYAIRIDATAPDQLVLNSADGSDRPDHRPTVWLSVRDVTSGVDYVEITPEGGVTKKTSLDQIAEGNPFVFVPTAAGTQNVHVKVIDHAGNFVEGDTQVVTLASIPPLLESPGDLIEGDELHAFGETYANVPVTVTVTDSHGRVESQTANSHADGTFDILWPRRVQVGDYSMMAYVLDPNGVRSESSSPVTFTVAQGLEYELSQLYQSYLDLLYGAMALFAVLLLALIVFSLRFIAFRRRLDEILHELQKEVNLRFDRLKKSKGHLTKEEEDTERGVKAGVEHALYEVHRHKKIHGDKGEKIVKKKK